MRIFINWGRQMTASLKKKLRSLGIALIWLLIWQFASMAVDSSLLLPSPIETAKSLFLLVQQLKFWQSVGMTLLRVMAGFLLGMLFGTALGVITYLSRAADAFFSPIRGVIKATPVTSFIILLLLWFSSSLTPVISAFLMVMPIFWTNVREGLNATDVQLLEMAEVFGFSRRKKLMHIYAPSTLPQLLAACITGIGFSWKSGVAAEVIASSSFSIGRSLYESKIYLEIPELFAWTATVIILSMVIEKLLVNLLGRARR